MQLCLRVTHPRLSLPAKSCVTLYLVVPQGVADNSAVDCLLRVRWTKHFQRRACPLLWLFLTHLIMKLTSSKGDEYLHLPAIVDAAESSPAAATEAAKRIRKFISKENHQRAYAQYNAIMLTRILTDNPAERFTRNFDTKFVTTTKDLLRDGRDMSVQQILRETLDYFESEKLAGNQSLSPLVEMWKKEKSKTGGRPYNNASVSLHVHKKLLG